MKKGSMRMFLRLFCLLFSLVVLPLKGEPITWMTSYQEALKKSKNEKKPLLLFFTGSDWSGWGMKMKKEILDSEDFCREISPRFVCVEIDFPRYKTLASEEAEQNVLLKKKLEILEYPRLILLDSSEREIARLGYSPEDGARFAEDLIFILNKDQSLTLAMQNLEKLSQNALEIQEYYKDALELRRSEDASHLMEIGLKSADPLFFLLERYRLLVEEGKSQQQDAIEIRKQLLKLDPLNAHKVQFSLALIDFQERACRNEIKNLHEIILPLENYLSEFGAKDKENVWRVEMMIAQFYLDADECKTALKHAETAYHSAPNDKKADLERSVDYIRKQASAIVEAGN